MLNTRYNVNWMFLNTVPMCNTFSKAAVTREKRRGWYSWHARAARSDASLKKRVVVYNAIHCSSSPARNKRAN
jgi:hypothetical protein